MNIPSVGWEVILGDVVGVSVVGVDVVGDDDGEAVVVLLVDSPPSPPPVVAMQHPNDNSSVLVGGLHVVSSMHDEPDMEVHQSNGSLSVQHPFWDCRPRHGFPSKVCACVKKEGVVVDSDRRAARIAGRCRLNIVVDYCILYCMLLFYFFEFDGLHRLYFLIT